MNAPAISIPGLVATDKRSIDVHAQFESGDVDDQRVAMLLEREADKRTPLSDLRISVSVTRKRYRLRFEYLGIWTLDERNALRYNTCRGQERYPARLLSKTAFGRSRIGYESEKPS